MGSENYNLDQILVWLCVPAKERFAQQHKKNSGMKNSHITVQESRPDELNLR